MVTGEFDLIASPMLLAELAEVLARPKLRRWVSETVAAEYLQGLAEEALIADDPPPQPGLSADPGDDYLVALARAAAADHLISGDRHLRDLRDPTTPGPHSPPVHRPAQEPK